MSLKLMTLGVFLCIPTSLAFAESREDANEDLSAIRIPPEAVERQVPLKPSGDLSEKRIYILGESERRVLIGESAGGYGYLPFEKHVVGQRIFFSDGKLAEEKNVRDGFLHGVWRQFYHNGQVFAERPYRHGKPDGVFRFWDEKGQLLGESKIDAGNGVLQEYPNVTFGTYDRTTPYVNGEIDGNVIDRIEATKKDGSGTEKLTTTIPYQRGEMEGWMVERREDKSIHAALYFHKDKLHGVVRNWKSNGQFEDGYPKYYVNGNEVSADTFRKAALEDPVLQISINEQAPAAK